ncbi:hypothetical protein GJ744_008767 [Endocarpon pusillum]|uniref:Rhodopsin domain-containing protein n=1 Tax=Endocarpon pusillum TaxID=364733 RepID=A0A8H7AQH4_9EURO|nr:hypothetical protein GJ744_008767 [Endocarpon pusillum]
MENLTPTAHASLTVGTTLSVLAGVAVVLRLIAKRLVKSRFAADDWWIVGSVLTMWVAGSILAWGLLSHDGRGAQGVNRQDPNFRYLKSMYVTSVLYYSVAAPAKISLLCLYRRIFAVHSFKRLSLLVGLLVVLWWLAATLANIFSCMPVQLMWELSLKGRCFNFNIFWFCTGIIETVIDIIILILPIKMIMRLQMSRRKKIVLSGIFLLGGFVIVTGGLRVAYAYDPGSMIVAFTGAELWTSCHLGTSVICACLPTYRPLLARIAAMATSLHERYSYRSWRSRSTGSLHSAAVATSGRGNNVHYYNGFFPNSLPGGDDKAHLTICHGSTSEDSVPDHNSPKSVHLERITVRSAVEVV